jgi:hypothetical protein
VAPDQDTAEDAAPVVQSSNWELIFLVLSALMLATAAVLVLYSAAQKYNAGIFAKSG